MECMNSGGAGLFWEHLYRLLPYPFLMPLEDDIEPVCLSGMEETAAIDRYIELHSPTLRKGLLYHCFKAENFVLPLGTAGIYISAFFSKGNTELLPFTAATLFLAVFHLYRKVSRTNRYVMQWFNDERERQGLNR